MPVDFSHPQILDVLGRHLVTQRTPSRALLAWYLENYYRLDDAELSDSICDAKDDKGIDGVYVDDNLQQIDVFQATIRTQGQSLGDAKLRGLAGCLRQFETAGSVRTLEANTENNELAGLLRDRHVADKVEAGYRVRGVLVTNARRDKNAVDFLNTVSGIVLHDADELSRSYVAIDREEPIEAPITVDIAGTPIQYTTASAEMAIALVPASELLKMGGIASGALFAPNVREWLGKKTPVNRQLEESIREGQEEHHLFPLFHNGISILCRELEVDCHEAQGETTYGVAISGYAVVNGCQSLVSLAENSDCITPALLIPTKFIKVAPHSDLAGTITYRSNNQNGVKARDLQSNSIVQTRLQTEIHREYAGQYSYHVKRGETLPTGAVIDNEVAARILLAFDLEEPDTWSQKYRLFDDLHAKIFARPEVNCHRIVILHNLYETVRVALKKMEPENQPFAQYSLTPFLVLYLVREALKTDPIGRSFCTIPDALWASSDGSTLQSRVANVVNAIVRFLEAYARRRNDNPDTFFDYKRELKSKDAISTIRSVIIPQYQITVDSGFIARFSDGLEQPTT